MKNENQDIVTEKCIKDDDDNQAFDDKSKLAAWICHYEKLLNVEFPWNSNTLSEEQPFQGPPKGDALLRGNYRGLKLLDQVMKVMEHILATIIRTQVDIDAMQFGFMPGRGTTDAIFILR